MSAAARWSSTRPGARPTMVRTRKATAAGRTGSACRRLLTSSTAPKLVSQVIRAAIATPSPFDQTERPRSAAATNAYGRTKARTPPTMAPTSRVVSADRAASPAATAAPTRASHDGAREVVSLIGVDDERGDAHRHRQEDPSRPGLSSRRRPWIVGTPGPCPARPPAVSFDSEVLAGWFETR